MGALWVIFKGSWSMIEVPENCMPYVATKSATVLPQNAKQQVHNIDLDQSDPGSLLLTS